MTFAAVTTGESFRRPASLVCGLVACLTDRPMSLSLATDRRSKTIIVFALLTVVFVPPAIVQAQDKPFEFHGLRSGMTRPAVRNHLELDAAAQKKKQEYSVLYRDKSIDAVVNELLETGVSAAEIKRFTGKQFRLSFFFTDEDLLWRLDVVVYKPADPARRLALDAAVRTRFKGLTIKEESTTSQYGTSEFYRVIMIDGNVLNPAVKRYTDEYMNKF